MLMCQQCPYNFHGFMCPLLSHGSSRKYLHTAQTDTYCQKRQASLHSSCPLEAQLLCDEAPHGWAIKHPFKNKFPLQNPNQNVQNQIFFQIWLLKSKWLLGVGKNQQDLPRGPNGPKQPRHHSEAAQSLFISSFTTKKNIKESGVCVSPCIIAYIRIRKKTTGHECRSTTCEATHYVHAMISGNVGIAVMPRENPIRPSMKISNHSLLHMQTHTQKQKKLILHCTEKHELYMLIHIQYMVTVLFVYMKFT